MDHLFSIVVKTSRSGNIISIMNTTTVSFPLMDSVEACTINSKYSCFESI